MKSMIFTGTAENIAALREWLGDRIEIIPKLGRQAFYPFPGLPKGRDLVRGMTLTLLQSGQVVAEHG